MSRRPLRLLLVEDDHEDAFLFERRCSERGALLQHVTTARDGLRALAEHEVDACFVDYRLGADDGLAFVRTARERHVRLPLIVITGHQIEVLGENALLAGATDFIPKEHLDASTIERTVRWARIRRHVEVHQVDREPSAIVASLMGRTPVATGTSRVSEPLRRVVQLSVARQPLTASDLLLMSSRFAATNARLGIGGALVYVGERFVNVIEGPGAAMDVMTRRIESDPRHTRLQILLDESSGVRLFDEWHMGMMRGVSTSATGARSDVTAEAAARLLPLLGTPTSRSGIQRLLLAVPHLP